MVAERYSVFYFVMYFNENTEICITETSISLPTQQKLAKGVTGEKGKEINVSHLSCFFRPPH